MNFQNELQYIETREKRLLVRARAKARDHIINKDVIARPNSLSLTHKLIKMLEYEQYEFF